MPTMTKQLEKELKPYKNTLVLVDDIVYQLIGIQEREDDFYWVLKTLRNKTKYHSCVGGWIPLKKYLPKAIYKTLVTTWNLNLTEMSVI